MSAFTSLIQPSTGSPSHNPQTRRHNGIQIGKEKVKLALFADDKTLYIENSKDTTKKLLELINEFSKVAGYKVISRNHYTNTYMAALFIFPEQTMLFLVFTSFCVLSFLPGLGKTQSHFQMTFDIDKQSSYVFVGSS